MESNQTQTGNSRARCTRAAIVLIVFVIVLFIGTMATRNRPTPPSPASPLIGSWTMANPQGSGTTRMLTFKANGQFTSMDFSVQSCAVLQDAFATWNVEGKMLVFRKHRAGVASLLDRIPGVGPAEDRIPILSISDGELLVGDRAAPITYMRGSNSGRAMAR